MSDLLDYSIRNLYLIADNFHQHLVKADAGQDSDLGFLKHQLSANNLYVLDEEFQVISIGGTNLLSAQACFTPELKISNSEAFKLPNLDNSFVLADLIYQTITPHTKLVCLNFAYPLEPTQNHGVLDGKLIRSTKEHKLEGVVGKTIGKWLVQELINREIVITVANDVVCLALSALNKLTDAPRDQIIGLVLGTGSNMSLFVDDSCIVNLESGNFGDFKLTQSGKYIDKMSVNPGQQLLEKEVAGAYMYQHFNFYSRQYGLGVELSDPGQFTHLLNSGSSEAVKLALGIVDRSSAIMAAILRGLWIYKHNQSISCVTEGGVYWKTKNYASYLDRWLLKLSVPEGSFKFLAVENSSLVGAAYLAAKF